MASPWAASYTTSPLQDADANYAMNSRSRRQRSNLAPVIPNRTPPHTAPTAMRQDSRSMASPWAASYTTSPLEDANANHAMNSRSRRQRSNLAPVVPNRTPPHTAPTAMRQDSRSTQFARRRPTTETPRSAWDQWHNTPIYPQQSGPSPHIPRQASHHETESHHYSRPKSPQPKSRRKRGNSVHIHLSWPSQGDLPTSTPEVRFITPYAHDMDTPSSFSRSVSSGPSISHVTYQERSQQWRPDFEFKSGIASVLRNTINNARASYGVSDSAKLELLTLLRYSKSHPGIICDLRREPERIILRESNRPLLENGAEHSVTHPPTKSMRIYHPRLPWYIDIRADGAPCISIEDFFLQLFAALNNPISKRDFYNNKLDDEDRKALNYAFRERCRSESEKMEGVKRVDFLREKFEWMGLIPGKDGMWCLKTG